LLVASEHQGGPSHLPLAFSVLTGRKQPRHVQHLGPEGLHTCCQFGALALVQPSPRAMAAPRA
jgi:hypothetical protein